MKAQNPFYVNIFFNLMDLWLGEPGLTAPVAAVRGRTKAPAGAGAFGIEAGGRLFYNEIILS
jgi:hypothetical protein